MNASGISLDPIREIINSGELLDDKEVRLMVLSATSMIHDAALQSEFCSRLFNDLRPFADGGADETIRQMALDTLAEIEAASEPGNVGLI